MKSGDLVEVNCQTAIVLEIFEKNLFRADNPDGVVKIYLNGGVSFALLSSLRKISS